MNTTVATANGALPAEADMRAAFEASQALSSAAIASAEAPAAEHAPAEGTAAASPAVSAEYGANQYDDGAMSGESFADAYAGRTAGEGAAEGIQAAQGAEASAAADAPSSDCGGTAEGAAESDNEQYGAAAEQRGGPQSGPGADSAIGFDERVQALSRQAEFIKAATGVDMIALLKAQPELLDGVGRHVSSAAGGFDLIGAYERYRRGLPRERAPLPEAGAYGAAGGGRVDVSRLSDDEIDDIDRRARQGERIVL